MLGNKKKLYIPEDTMFEPIAPKGIVSYVARISPSDAVMLLERNERNRRQSKDTLNMYIKDMNEGLWKDSASQVQVSNTGKLLNGQHRLRAIVESNTSQILTITEGIDDECFRVLDVGRARSASDALSIIDFKNSPSAASMIKFWMVWRDGIEGFDMKRDQTRYENAGTKGVTNNRFRRSSKASWINEVLNFAMERPNVDHLAGLARDFNKGFRPFSSTFLGAFLIQADILGHQTRGLAEEFLEKLSTGAGLSEKDPILVCRNRVSEWVALREWQSMGKGYRFQVLLITWNRWVSGKSLERFRVSEDNPEDMNSVMELSEEAA